MHIVRGEDKQGARPSMSDQAGVEKLADESKSPVNIGQEAAIPVPCLAMVLLP